MTITEIAGLTVVVGKKTITVRSPRGGKKVGCVRGFRRMADMTPAEKFRIYSYFQARGYNLDVNDEFNTVYADGSLYFLTVEDFGKKLDDLRRIGLKVITVSKIY